MLEKDQRVTVIVQARLGSSRLPGKSLLPLADGKPIIEWVLRAVKRLKSIETGVIRNIVVATSDNSIDDPLVRWCHEHDTEVFRGSETDVLTRYYQCAEKYGAKWVLRICGDCPFLNDIMAYGLIKELPRTKYRALSFNDKRIPGGWDAELFSFAYLEEANKYARNPMREHVTLWMRHDMKPDMGTDFKFDIKLDVDTKEDYDRLFEYSKGYL